MIKIRVTDEIYQAHAKAWHDNPRPLDSPTYAIRAVLDIIERDLNITDNLVGRHKPGEYNQIVKSNGCVEVND